MVNRLVFTLLAGILAAASGPGFAQPDPHAGHGAPAMIKTSAASEASEATVKKLDPAAGKVTLAHGPLKNLGMPAMTMVFRVKDGKVLATLKEGDRIRFVAEYVANVYYATRIEKVK